MSYLDRTNPNLALFLHFLAKLAWIILAAFFGYIGLELYKAGVSTTGSGRLSVFGVDMTLENAGPGLVVMVVSLLCALVGAVRAKIELRPDVVTMAAPARQPPAPVPVPVPEFNQPSSRVPGQPIRLDDITIKTFSRSDAAVVLGPSGDALIATCSYRWLSDDLLQQIPEQIQRSFGPNRTIGASQNFMAETSRGETIKVEVQLMGNPAADSGPISPDGDGDEFNSPGYLVAIQLTDPAKKREFLQRRTQPSYPMLPELGGPTFGMAS